MRFFRRKPEPKVDEYAAATERWRQHNARARAEGCKCGREATHVRYMHGTTGAVPAETWSCEEHVNVNAWSKSASDAFWTPVDDYSESALAWVSPAIRPV